MESHDLPALAVTDSSGIDEARAEACAWADSWLRWRVRTCARACAVFDIDATLIDSGGKPIEPVIALYKRALSLGITCFIVTARTDDGRSYALQELRGNGIPTPRHLFMHPRHDPCINSETAGRAKERARERIRQRSYEIVLNIGDAFHDHYTPPLHASVRRSIGHNCGVFVDPHTSCAHVKLPHPVHA
jgi:hypothetical protein